MRIEEPETADGADGRRFLPLRLSGIMEKCICFINILERKSHLKAVEILHRAPALLCEKMDEGRALRRRLEAEVRLRPQRVSSLSLKLAT